MDGVNLSLRSRGLRAKIISWFLLPTAAILLAVALVTYYGSERATQDLVMERNQELARLLAEQLSTELHTYPDRLKVFVSSYPNIYAYDLAAQQATLRQNIDNLIPFDGGVLLLDRFGQVVAADRLPLSVLGQDWSDYAFVRRMLASPQVTFSDIGQFWGREKEAVVVAVPVVDVQGQFQGMMAGLFLLDSKTSAFYQSILKLRLYGRGDQGDRVISLVDGGGRAIFHADVLRIGQALSSQPAVERVLAGEVGALRTQGLSGREVVASFAPLPGSNWGLVVEESWAAMTEPSRGYQRWLLLLLALGVGVPVSIVAVGSRRITQPIAELSRAAQEIAGGNLHRTITIDTGDELQALAHQFNRMSAQLLDSYAHLEQRVTDRTQELSALNAIANVVSRSLDLEEILQAALDKTLDTVGLEAGGAFRLEPDGQTLSLIAHRGLSQPFVRRAARLPLADSAAGQAAARQGPLVRPVAQYPSGSLKNLLQAEGLELVVSVPLLAKGRLVGALNLATRAPRAITAEELSLLAAVGGQAGIAVENARLYEQAEQHAVAAERSRLARDLHDAVTQTLFSASLIADVLPRIWERDPDAGRERLDELRQLTRGALAEMRTLLLELRPAALEEAELPEVLRQLTESVIGRARIPVALRVEGACDLPADVKVTLYRVAQEALSNVVKHAGASQAAVGLRCRPGSIRLEISDDGRGFDPARVPSNHLGLSIMQERAQTIGATLDVRSSSGQGSQVVLTWSKKSV